MKQPRLISIQQRLTFAVLVSAAPVMGSALAANLVHNGDFDNVGEAFKANTPQGGDDIQTAGGTKIPGWTSVAKFVNELWVAPSNGYNLTASSGNNSGYFVDLTGQADAKPYGGLEQKITTVPGTGYTLSFALGASTIYNTSGTGEAALTTSVTGNSKLVSHRFSLNPTSANEWKTETLTFIADSDSTTIEFLADSDNTSRYTGLDNVVVESRLLSTSTQLTASPTTADSGSSVSLTALVKPLEGLVTPTGKVQFQSGSTMLGSATLNGAGQATFSTSSLKVGKDSLTAVYAGDSIHSTSTSEPVTVAITAATAKLTLSPTFVAFDNQASGSTSGAKAITIKNRGSTTASISSITLAGSQADDFSLSKTCGSSLAANASCTVSVTFKPVSTGSKAASFSVVDNAAGSPQTVSLSGTGTSGSSGATVTLSSTSLAFGNQTSGSSSAVKAVTIENSGSTTVSISSIKLTGSQADDFVVSKSCGSTLAADSSCTVSVTFKPVSTGSKAASLSITDNATGSPQTVALSGTGTSGGSGPAASLSVTTLAFGGDKVGSTSSAKTTTLTNTGSATLTFKSIQVSGGQADDFMLSKTCGSSLASKASCTLSVTFKPVSTGIKSASISVADNASGSPQSVALSGTGS